MDEKISAFLKLLPAGECKGCKALIWWITTRKGKAMPINQDLTSHFSNCPQGRQFRKDIDG